MLYCITQLQRQKTKSTCLVFACHPRYTENYPKCLKTYFGPVFNIKKVLGETSFILITYECTNSEFWFDACATSVQYMRVFISVPVFLILFDFPLKEICKKHQSQLLVWKIYCSRGWVGLRKYRGRPV